MRGDVADGGSDRVDASMLECMQAPFSKLKFPRPDEGIVTVTFPILLEPPGGTATPLCRPLPDRCQDDGDCAGAVSCRAGKCSDDLAPSGSRCDDHGDCAADLYCELEPGEWEGRCTLRKKDGAACSHALQCSGICGRGDKCRSFCDGG